MDHFLLGKMINSKTTLLNRSIIDGAAAIIFGL
jgi:hypothetical protein